VERLSELPELQGKNVSLREDVAERFLAVLLNHVLHVKCQPVLACELAGEWKMVELATERLERVEVVAILRDRQLRVGFSALLVRLTRPDQAAEGGLMRKATAIGLQSLPNQLDVVPQEPVGVLQLFVVSPVELLVVDKVKSLVLFEGTHWLKLHKVLYRFLLALGTLPGSLQLLPLFLLGIIYVLFKEGKEFLLQQLNLESALFEMQVNDSREAFKEGALLLFIIVLSLGQFVGSFWTHHLS